MTVTESPSRRVPRWRRITAWVLLVVGCLLLGLGGVAVWVRNLLLDTDRYVETVAPLARDPEIVGRVAEVATDALFDAIDAQDLAQDALPDRASFLTGPLVDALEGFVEDQVVKLLETEQFQDIWDEANRRAHTQVEALLTGGGKVVSTEGGDVTLDLQALLTRVQLKLVDAGIGIFEAVPIERVAVNLELFRSENIRKGQDAIDLLQKVALWLPILAIASLVGAVLLAADRRRALVRVGVGVAIAAFVLGIGVALGRSFYLDALGPGHPAADNVFDILVRFFRNGIRTVFALGLVLACGAWLAGPGRTATRVRDLVTRHGEREGRGPVATWIGTNRRVLEVLAVVGGALVLIAADRPGPAGVLLVALLVGVAFVVVEVVGGRPRSGAGEGGTPAAPGA